MNKPFRLRPEHYSLRYIHAAGPGGQHVNKVATAVQLRFALNGCPALPDDVRTRLKAIAGSRLNRNEEIVLTAKRFRSQARNRDEVITRLEKLLERAWRAPKKRIATRPKKSALKRRRDEKARRSKLKQHRRKPGLAD